MKVLVACYAIDEPYFGGTDSTGEVWIFPDKKAQGIHEKRTPFKESFFETEMSISEAFVASKGRLNVCQVPKSQRDWQEQAYKIINVSANIARIAYLEKEIPEMKRKKFNAELVKQFEVELNNLLKSNDVSK